MEEIRRFLSAPEWQGISGILAIVIPIVGTIWGFVKYKLVSNIRKNKLILGIIVVYFVCGYLIIHSGQALWIFWWFILMVSIYIVNQLVSFPELFVKGFQDDFRNGLEIQNWEYYGDWLVMNESDGNILQVSNSDAGGISINVKLGLIIDFHLKQKL